MAVDRERILGNALSWASWTLRVKGNEFYGVLKMSIGQKRERAKVYGTGRARKPRGRTGGKYSATCKMTVARGSTNDLIAFLAQYADDGISYGNVEFDLVGQQVENGNETPTFYVVNGCVIADENFDDDGESIDASKDEIELDPLEVIKNGLTLYDNTRL
jgi:hypothetical protein